jgi:hypothetical protein
MDAVDHYDRYNRTRSEYLPIQMFDKGCGERAYLYSDEENLDRNYISELKPKYRKCFNGGGVCTAQFYDVTGKVLSKWIVDVEKRYVYKGKPKEEVEREEALRELLKHYKRYKIYHPEISYEEWYTVKVLNKPYKELEIICAYYQELYGTHPPPELVNEIQVV